VGVIVTNGYPTHFWICHSFLDKYIYNICKYIQQTPYYMVYSKGINGITGGSRVLQYTNIYSSEDYLGKVFLIVTKINVTNIVSDALMIDTYFNKYTKLTESLSLDV
jgi:hypothetical protein